MLAPIDKVKKPGGNRYIQVEITTVCNLKCSNCTRLTPFRRDFRHMSIDCFRKAVQSLQDWPGVVAIFGGNPPTHPQFAELMEIFCEEIPDQKRRGLWANNLLKHGELIRRVFYPEGTFNLNAHGDINAAAEIERWLPGRLISGSDRTASRHGPILMDRREYGIDDRHWVRLREHCDINIHWSGAIVERDGEPYAYFCEVASSIDGVRGANHGVRVEPGWWRWGMERFVNQVDCCCDRGCGVPIRLRGHLDRDETYDLSPGWRAVVSKRRTTAVQAHPTLPGRRARELTDYMRLRGE